MNFVWIHVHYSLQDWTIHCCEIWLYYVMKEVCAGVRVIFVGGCWGGRVCPFLWSWMRRERSGVDQCYWVWREAEHTFTAGMRPYICHQISVKLVCRPTETLVQYSLPCYLWTVTLSSVSEYRSHGLPKYSLQSDHLESSARRTLLLFRFMDEFPASDDTRRFITVFTRI
jgi:hypothetical protein